MRGRRRWCFGRRKMYRRRLIGFEALGEFYSPTGKLLEFRELVAIAEQVWGIRIKNFRQLKSRVLKRYKEKTVLDQMERLIEKLREQEYK